MFSMLSVANAYVKRVESNANHGPNIPGRGTLQLAHVVLDVNGTIAKDGRLLDKVAKPLAGLRDRLTIHLLTADTYGSGEAELLTFW